MKRCGKVLRVLALAAFCAVMLSAMAYAWIICKGSSISLATLLLGMLFAMGFIAAGHALQNISEQRLKAIFPIALATTTALYIIISCWFMHAYRYTPVWDPDAVFTGAQSWLAGSLTSVSTPTYDAATYFYYFPNNLGATLVLRTWFALTGSMDPYLSACTLNCIVSSMMIVCLACAARELSGRRGGILALVMLVCTLPIWFSCAAFYTDFLSIGFPVGALFAALKAEKAEDIRIKILFWISSGLLAAIGAMIKITVLILPIGVVLWQLLRGRWKDALGLTLAVALLFGTGQLVLQKSVYPDQLDPERAAQMNTPIQHWIMMGLRGDGYYNPEDYAFTRSFSDKQECRAALNAQIGTRIREYGVVGFFKHIFRKMGICMSDGTLMLSDYYDDYPVAADWLQSLLLPGGDAYANWRTICNGVHMAQMALALLGAIKAFKREEKDMAGAMYLSLFGLLVFLSMWETSKRYWINFLPILILCAMQGALPSGEKRAKSMAQTLPE